MLDVMKKAGSITIYISLCLMVCGCTRSAAGVRESRYGMVPEQMARNLVITPEDSADKHKEEQPGLKSYPYEYSEAIRLFRTKNLLPDGSSVSLNGGDIENSDYCIVDIDGDNTEELLIRYNGSFSEDESRDEDAIPPDAFEAVYEYQPSTETCICELYEHKGIKYFAQGTALVPWNGSASLSDGSASMNIYEYDLSTDTYIYAGCTDCWDADMAPADPEDRQFPTELDLDEDKKLYALQYYSEYDSGYIYEKKDYDKLSDSLRGKAVSHSWRSI